MNRLLPVKIKFESIFSALGVVCAQKWKIWENRVHVGFFPLFFLDAPCERLVEKLAAVKNFHRLLKTRWGKLKTCEKEERRIFMVFHRNVEG
jgi:hypothetical protein